MTFWSNRKTVELNDSYVKLVKLKGEFIWHHHEAEDELFLVVKGRLLIKLRDRDLRLDEGEFVVIPKGVEHLPVAEESDEACLRGFCHNLRSLTPAATVHRQTFPSFLIQGRSSLALPECSKVRIHFSIQRHETHGRRSVLLRKIQSPS